MFSNKEVLMEAETKPRSARSIVEYGLVAGLIAVAIVSVLTTMGADLTNAFHNVQALCTVPDLIG
jgi:hypothetical protein